MIILCRYILITNFYNIIIQTKLSIYSFITIEKRLCSWYNLYDDRTLAE